VLEAYFPAAQPEHDTEPVETANRPAAQFEQTEAPLDEYIPLLHALQLTNDGDIPALDENVPDEHSEHAIDPALG
jgi:hypothetical protein